MASHAIETLSGARQVQRSNMKALVFHAGIGDYKIVTTLCPGGKERMRRLMELVALHRIDLSSLLTHTFSLDQIVEAYRFFGAREDGVIKVAIKTHQ